MPLEDEFGDVIAKARTGRGLSAAQLAKFAGLDEPQLSEIEHYLLKPPEEIVKQLAKTLHLDPKKLLETASGAWNPPKTDPSTNSLFVHQIHVPFGQYGENAYIAACAESRIAAVIDPGGSIDAIKRTLSDHQFTLAMILVTHAHADHIGGLRELTDSFPGVTIACSPIDRESVMGGMSAKWQAGEGGSELRLGQITVKAIATPGHTPGSTCYFIDRACFVGDTLFAGSIGRPASITIYAQMLASIKTKLLGLPGSTVLLPGHGPITTVAEELEHNPFF